VGDQRDQPVETSLLGPYDVLERFAFHRPNYFAIVVCAQSFQFFDDFRELSPGWFWDSLIVEQPKVILLWWKGSPSRVNVTPYSDSSYAVRSMRSSTCLCYILGLAIS